MCICSPEHCRNYYTLRAYKFILCFTLLCHCLYNQFQMKCLFYRFVQMHSKLSSDLRSETEMGYKYDLITRLVFRSYIFSFYFWKICIMHTTYIFSIGSVYHGCIIKVLCRYLYRWGKGGDFVSCTTASPRQ